MTTTAEPRTDALETTELRWFGTGPVPGDVASWFTDDGRLGTVEDRTDLYRADGRPDLGVKRRSGTTLELKVRVSVDSPISLGAGVGGPTEVWHKWSPAVAPEPDGDPPWIEVRKHVVKRLFSDEGDEVVFSPAARDSMAAGCDVELAGVSVGEHRAWTFAFAAFGPAHLRRSAILACWRQLIDADPVPGHLDDLTTSAGYPQWLQLSR